MLVLDLLIELLQLGAVGGGAICLEHLDISGSCVSRAGAREHVASYSAVRGVIFFSSTSSSAKFLWYFSHDWPVAEGMPGVAGWTCVWAWTAMQGCYAWE